MKAQNTEARPMESGEATAMRDPEVGSSGQTVEQHDNAYYERLRYFAELIGLTEAVQLPEASVNEEKRLE